MHCLGHRIKYGNPKIGNTIQQFLSATWQCCSIEFIELFLFWVFFFFLIFNRNVFSTLHAKHFEIWKKFLWNWWADCLIAQSIKWCDISGCSFWIHFSFDGVDFFLRKTVFPLVSSSLTYSLITFDKPEIISIIFWDS